VSEDDALDLVLGKLDDVRPQPGRRWMARCPAHDDNEPSLGIALGTDQPVVVRCHAGCEQDDVLAAIGLSMADICRPREDRQPEGEWMPCKHRSIAVYDYVDERGKLLFQVLRCPHKHFRQRHPDPAAPYGWAWNMKGVTRVPYRLPAIRRTARAPVAGRVIYIAEGEKDVHAIEAAGAVATCNPMDAGKWGAEFGKHLAGIRRAIIIADKDEPGRAHATQVAESVRRHGHVIAIEIVEAAEGKDAHDHLAAGRTLAEFVPVDLSAMPPGKSATSATSVTPAGQPVADAPAASATPSATPATTWDGDLGDLLTDVSSFLGRFIAYPSEHARVAHALWIAHAHAMGAWESTPRIAFLSPEPGSGKTRALEVSELLVPRPVEAINATPAYLFRKVSDPAGAPTILYDEIDTLFGPKAKDNEDVRGMLNAGHRRGAMAGRCVVRGKEVHTEELPAYCAVALAGLGNLPDTLMTRSVVVRMRRRAPNEPVTPFRRRVNEAEGHAIRDNLAAWATSATAKGIGDAWPEMPPGIADRAADVWESLFMIADSAGGDWPRRARVAAVALVADSREGKAVSLGIRLLGDIRQIWDGSDGMHTDTLLELLNNLDEAPWGDLRGKQLDPRGMARMLREYDVRPGDVRHGSDVRKGYKRAELHDAWLRYLPPSGDSATTATPATCAGSASDASERERSSGPSSHDGEKKSATRPCAKCGDPLDPSYIAAGFTDHGEEA
jgi:hypothetical protein